ncbi:AraC family transcriptional regulator [Dyella sp.]|uniref:AraC family transcriptional regulator n=1 Tax=Dyella sp. TaxID=1869338 RepID=UPI00284E8A08|nr:AraC family transcriptional regulator [Dyella sp.]MDR3445928.1 AraC family transcriptional regulator [Dyella sp.]
MKANTREDYLQRIDRVVAVLQAAVEKGDELPELARLAGVAHLSPFHFHRIYRAMSGETVGQTVARLRLLRALQLLAEPSERVTETALAVGYETPQAFARAFRQAFDASPSELRGQAERLREAMQRLRLPPVIAAEPTLRVEVVSVEPFRVVASRYVGDHRDLDQAYGRLFAWAAGHALLERMAGIYGVPHDGDHDAVPDHGAFDCALAFDGGDVATDDETYLIHLGGGPWARWRHKGPYDHLGALTDRLIASWLPGSGYVLRDESPFRHFLDDPENVPAALLRADVYLPVAPS